MRERRGLIFGALRSLNPLARMMDEVVVRRRRHRRRPRSLPSIARQKSQRRDRCVCVCVYRRRSLDDYYEASGCVEKSDSRGGPCWIA